MFKPYEEAVERALEAYDERRAEETRRIEEWLKQELDYLCRHDSILTMPNYFTLSLDGLNMWIPADWQKRLHATPSTAAPAQAEPVINRERFPHDCPLCQSPAYLGAVTVECTNKSCRHYKE
jgi:hypothetical protein